MLRQQFWRQSSPSSSSLSLRKKVTLFLLSLSLFLSSKESHSLSSLSLSFFSLSLSLFERKSLFLSHFHKLTIIFKSWIYFDRKKMKNLKDEDSTEDTIEYKLKLILHTNQMHPHHTRNGWKGIQSRRNVIELRAYTQHIFTSAIHPC